MYVCMYVRTNIMYVRIFMMCAGYLQLWSLRENYRVDVEKKNASLNALLKRAKDAIQVCHINISIIFSLLYTHMHACIHTYIHSSIHTYIHTLIHKSCTVGNQRSRESSAGPEGQEEEMKRQQDGNRTIYSLHSLYLLSTSCHIK